MDMFVAEAAVEGGDVSGAPSSVVDGSSSLREWFRRRSERAAADFDRLWVLENQERVSFAAAKIGMRKVLLLVLIVLLSLAGAAAAAAAAAGRPGESVWADALLLRFMSVPMTGAVGMGGWCQKGWEIVDVCIAAGMPQAWRRREQIEVDHHVPIASVRHVAEQ
ncbi:uncharacterized protein CCOS01_01476 [Colletotrichum costaricense]|uniref:Uncharacterized protein n=1 Tax=Colletotrichum costaricense TaxID=1209916 RepID=A0AAI9ZB84_9PEZI|nr:uncharacterized protein CCOS01_01476 [Colletotrichum costaricense]KAK1540162.1 hypothetical protein CCOS01_01476 [Colletotrichum costaricense]